MPMSMEELTQRLQHYSSDDVKVYDVPELKELTETMAAVTEVQRRAQTRIEFLTNTLAERDAIILRQRERLLECRPITVYQVCARLRNGEVVAVLPLHAHRAAADARAKALDKDDRVYKLFDVVSAFVKEITLDWTKADGTVTEKPLVEAVEERADG